MYTGTFRPGPDGEIYIGVVGPVRTGKSTFIKRFMELLVLPGMDGSTLQGTRARDELPQSAAGKTIMTTEPKFIPKEAAQISWPTGLRQRSGSSTASVLWWTALPDI